MNDLRGDKTTVMMFICNHCPFVKYVLKDLISLANDYMQLGIFFIAISANDVVSYPEDSPVEMKKLAQNLSFPFLIKA